VDAKALEKHSAPVWVEAILKTQCVSYKLFTDSYPLENQISDILLLSSLTRYSMVIHMCTIYFYTKNTHTWAMVQLMFLRIFSDYFPRFICFVMEEIVEPIFTETNDKRYKTIILPVVLYGCETWSLT
jgi:hypothetical protein